MSSHPECPILNKKYYIFDSSTSALRAAEGLSNLNLLFPMISAVSELEEAIHIVRRAYEGLVEEGVRVTWPRVGVMIEVPAAVYQA